MQAAKIDAGISSWWGQNSETDLAFPKLLQAAAGTSFKWAIYYELDQDGSRPQTAVNADLRYIKTRYANDPSYLKVNGKPVVFIYAPNGTCATARKWQRVKNQQGFYTSMIDVDSWWQDCPHAMDSWHQYRPDLPVAAVTLDERLYSVSVSAGFWAAWEASSRLERNFETWKYVVDFMNSYPFEWQLVYFNEWGEGSGIEPSNAQCQVAGCRDYINVLGAHHP